MRNYLQQLQGVFEKEREAYKLQRKLVWLLLLAPVLIAVGFCVAWFVPVTYKLALWVSKENHPAELLTFVFLIFGSVIGGYLAWYLKSKHEKVAIWALYTGYAIALFVIAMEEISWGQQLLGFETPDAFKEMNEQKEVTLHNLEGIQGNSEYFHLIFGLGGLIGTYFYLYALNPMRVPMVLSAFFFTIVAITSVDLYHDFFPFEHHTGFFIRRLSEINEMLIGFAGFMYVVLSLQKFKFKYELKNLSFATREEAVHPDASKENVLLGI
ncbi:hypothetical protein MKJ04_22510 [Pontibacter sp. E15-1]|uniref:hypothetical protein n=1 Tax=Pontibacter sp. E15-1 TaxID=2919918 RepID=UPI001F4F6035|nr:hypothetical protein [Pontibacter sp. E15-1]MCJ8167633.1 hypothetical protein [Pontibacter sp. E15-1]